MRINEEEEISNTENDEEELAENIRTNQVTAGALHLPLFASNKGKMIYIMGAYTHVCGHAFTPKSIYA